MKLFLLISVVALALLLAIILMIFLVKRHISTVPKQNPTRDMYLNSLYICVYDMERAISFYESFFEQKVSERDEIYSVFQLYGFRFGLFAFEKKHEAHSFGSNCLPSVAMGSLDYMKEKLEGLTIVFPITQIGRNWVAEFEDSEGNHIEVTAPVL